jgi:hypothetical protein
MKTRHYDRNAQGILAEISINCETKEDYTNLIWAMRYPQPSLIASKGWPYQMRKLPPPVQRKGKAFFEVIK